ncbi:hypothetical protein G7054_g9134 [Neopestalotiopsis clavispora]|nr:hypothetical protein G7054_g9134 [Neopestalotiopsis clavispora]
MEQENMRSVPKEMPASHRTTSHETLVEDLATQATDYSASEQGTHDEDNLSRRNHYGWNGPMESAATQANDYSTEGVPEDPNLTSDNECLPTTKNLTDILLTLEDPRHMRPRNTHLTSSGRVYDAQRARARRTQFMGVEKLAQECSGASTTTLVDEEPALTSIMTTPSQTAPDSSPKGAVLRMLRLTGLINVLHLCMILINSWGLDIASQPPVVEKRNRPLENDAAISSR